MIKANPSPKGNGFAFNLFGDPLHQASSLPSGTKMIAFVYHIPLFSR